MKTNEYGYCVTLQEAPPQSNRFYKLFDIVEPLLTLSSWSGFLSGWSTNHFVFKNIYDSLWGTEAPKNWSEGACSELLFALFQEFACYSPHRFAWTLLPLRSSTSWFAWTFLPLGAWTFFVGHSFSLSLWRFRSLSRQCSASFLWLTEILASCMQLVWLAGLSSWTSLLHGSLLQEGLKEHVPSSFVLDCLSS